MKRMFNHGSTLCESHNLTFIGVATADKNVQKSQKLDLCKKEIAKY